MKLSLFRAWRANRLIEQAMRNSPPPKPPEGLRDRLIQQALSAEATALPQAARSRSRLVWLAPVAVVALIVCWIAFRGPAPETKHETILSPVPIPAQEIVKTPPKSVPTVVHQPKIALRVSHPRLRHKQRAPRHLQVAEQHQVQEPSIRISVTRTPEPTVGYARVAAYSTDDSGREVRTAWTLVDNPQTRTSSQEMSVDSTSGQRQLLKVAVVMPSNESKGEEL